ncbi:MAG: radical SAM protein [Promethearchaeota archaeon]
MEIKSLPPEIILIRPPVEAYSILIAVTGGCSWNHCRFCATYKNNRGIVQEYAIRPLGDILNDIDLEAALHPNHKWVFLAGGNATSAPTDFLCKIIKHVRKRFKRIERVSCYSKALDIVRKTDEELKQLAEAGLDIVYMGLESGSKNVLRIMKKGTNDRTFIKVGNRLLKAGIKLSLYVLLGLGGYKLSEEHVRETARVLTAINPTIFRFRTLNVGPSNLLLEDVATGKLKILKPVDVLKEERDIIKFLGDNVTSEVYNDHISNYFAGQTKNIKNDREWFVKALDELINNPQIQNMERKTFLHL